MLVHDRDQGRIRFTVEEVHDSYACGRSGDTDGQGRWIAQYKEEVSANRAGALRPRIIETLGDPVGLLTGDDNHAESAGRADGAGEPSSREAAHRCLLQRNRTAHQAGEARIEHGLTSSPGGRGRRGKYAGMGLSASLYGELQVA